VSVAMPHVRFLEEVKRNGEAHIATQVMARTSCASG
jgi:hypothetical protein